LRSSTIPVETSIPRKVPLQVIFVHHKAVFKRAAHPNSVRLTF